MLEPEIRFLLGYDRAREALSQSVDLPEDKLREFILTCQQNNFQLANRRRNRFPRLSDEEVRRMERTIRKAFQGPVQRARTPKPEG